MQELIQSLQQKLGLDAGKAQQAVQTVVSFIKSKLPESMHQPIDAAISGGNVQDMITNAGGKLGSFLK